MPTASNLKTVTYEEWLRMPEVEDGREEVVDGEIILMPPARWKHALIVERFGSALKSQLDAARVLVLLTSFGLVIRKSPLTTRAPDIAVFELSSIVEHDGYIHSPPQLLVAVLSPANTGRKMQQKLADYPSIGVPEVWVVSPEARTREVLLLENGQLVRSALLAEGFLKPTRFPHVQIDIAQIWPD